MRLLHQILKTQAVISRLGKLLLADRDNNFFQMIFIIHMNKNYMIHIDSTVAAKKTYAKNQTRCLT